MGKVHATITPDRVDKRQNGRRSKEDEDPMFTLTAQDLHGVILRPERTEYGKSIRKDYENGNVEEKWGICVLYNRDQTTLVILLLRY